MIVDVATYAEGRRAEADDLTGALARCHRDGGFLWLGLKDPSPEELQRVADALDLPATAVRDVARGPQRPKIAHYGDTVVVVCKPLDYVEETSDVLTGEVVLFAGPHHVVSVRRGDSGGLRGVRARVEADPDRLRGGPRAVVQAVVAHVVDGYAGIDAELERDVDEVEEQVFSPDRSSDAQRIYSLKREVLEVRRAAAPLVAPLRDLAADEARSEASRYQLRDVLDHLVRTVEHVESYDRLLTDILNAHLAQVSVRQNEDMRTISAWAAMFAVPTLIAGVYGMNFDHMPELHWQLGYPLCLLLMVLACAALYRSFKRSGWL